jgi:hypothetical protein
MRGPTLRRRVRSSMSRLEVKLHVPSAPAERSPVGVKGTTERQTRPPGTSPRSLPAIATCAPDALTTALHVGATAMSSPLAKSSDPISLDLPKAVRNGVLCRKPRSYPAATLSAKRVRKLQHELFSTYLRGDHLLEPLGQGGKVWLGRIRTAASRRPLP